MPWHRHRLFCVSGSPAKHEDGRDSEPHEDHGRHGEVSENLIEGTEHSQEAGQVGLDRDRSGRGVIPGMKRGRRREEQAVARYGEADPRHRHQERGQASQNRDDDDQGKNHAPRSPEQRLTGQGGERFTRINPLGRNQVEENQTDQNIHERDYGDAQEQGPGEIAPGVADLAGDLADVPPASQRKEGRDHAADQSPHQRIRVWPLLHQGNEEIPVSPIRTPPAPRSIRARRSMRQSAQPCRNQTP